MLQEETGNGGALITAGLHSTTKPQTRTYGFTMFLLLLLLQEYIIMPPSSAFCNNILCVCQWWSNDYVIGKRNEANFYLHYFL